MKIRVCLLPPIFLTFVHLLMAMNPNWISTGPDGGPVNCFATSSSSTNTLYLGTWSMGVYKTTDGGNNWIPKNVGLPLSDGSSSINMIVEIEIASSSPETVYLATYEHGVYKSTTGGENWFPVNSGLSNLNIRSLFLDPSSNNRLIIATDSGLFKSTNGGNSWTNISSIVSTCLIYDPTTPQVVYASTFGQGIYKSTDNGQTWNPINNGLSATTINTLTIDSAQPGILFAGSFNKGVYKSTDAGETWTQTSTGLTEQNIRCLAVDPLSSNTVYCGTSNGLFKSSNGGQTWVVSGTGIESYYINCLAFSTAASPLYLGTQGGLYKTEDGEVWSAINNGIKGHTINSISIDQVSRKNIFVGTGESVFKSTDRGMTWTSCTPAPGLRVVQVAVAPSSSNIVYAGGYLGNLWKSTDGGNTWDLILIYPISSIAIDPGDANKVYVGGDYAVEASHDGGYNWWTIPGLQPIYTICVDPGEAATLYAGTTRGVYKTLGGNWIQLTNGIPAYDAMSVMIDPHDRRVVYASVQLGFYKSTDSGNSWNRKSEVTSARDLAIDSLDSNKIYMGTYGLGILESIDGGSNWHSFGLDTLRVLAVAADPITSGRIYAGTESAGLFQTYFDSYDLNLDGQINSTDLLLLEAVVSENLSNLPCADDCADLNQDGKINVVDILLLHSDLTKR